MICFRRIAFVIIAGLFGGVAGGPVGQGFAADKPVIHWISGPIPEAVIEENGQMSGGFLFETVRWFASRMPGYTHRYQLVPLKRTHQLLQNADRIYCGFSLLRNAARARLYHFSEPIHWAQGFRAGYRAGNEDVEHSLIEGKGLDMAQFLAGTGKAGRILGRSYNPQLDLFLEELKGQGRLLEVPEQAGLMEMLGRDRIDLLIDYPRMFLGTEKLSTVSVIGVKPYNAIHFACAMTTEGRAVIDRVDGIIADEPALPGYAAFRLRMLPPDHARALADQFVRYREDNNPQSSDEAG
ncbi:hypothetical protein [Aestuariispira insulae]|uniref:Uncharacterized protein (TIGR02285 family) n=1 Tax=Aestuariispira insulae TaxID=1461337 RepID=A0A3D9HR84_9PROT|nr:hypothetical protein [Aestuariispira insulae]RED52044.1 uncharacterized protein (TIGR02285 family) [Aestuariispira insulae]